MSITEEIKYKVVGYVKLAKLWEKRRDYAIDYHHKYYESKYSDSDIYSVVDVFIDITGNKEIYKRPGMLKTIKQCMDGKANCIATQTKGYLAANTKEFCYLIKLLFSIDNRIDIITEDESYNINTIANSDMQRECLLKMANDYVALNPSDYEKWVSGITSAMEKISEEQ